MDETAVDTDTEPRYDWVEVRIWAVPRVNEDPEKLMEEIMISADQVACDPIDWEVCFHCGGSGFNPESSSAIDLPGWTEGLPCAVCSLGERPGYIQPCGREHGASGEIVEDGLTFIERKIYNAATVLYDGVTLGTIDAGDLKEGLQVIIDLVRPWSLAFDCEDCGGSGESNSSGRD